MAHQTLEQALEEILIWYEGSNGHHDFRKGFVNNKPLDLSFFNGAEPLLPNYIDLKDDPSFLLTGVRPSDLSRPLDLSLVVQADGSNKFALTRIRQTSPKMLRGKVREFYPLVAELKDAHISQDGTYRIGLNYAGWTGSSWRVLSYMPDRVAPLSSKAQAELTTNLTYACMIQFTRRYNWVVRLGFDKQRTVSFTTDPLGAREVFRLRDIPEGKARRASLLHWVSAHWRKKRSDPQEEFKVREHLRGAKEFAWNGMYCSIQPSEYEQDKLR